MKNDYRICARCIMDTTDTCIQFDKDGICNYCKAYDERIRKELHIDEAGQQKLNGLVREIKEHGNNKEYDCIIGLSGGVDSTTVAYKVIELGLRPYAIHLDNGWNTEVSEHNIQKICEKLNIELHISRVNWEQFKDIQLAYLKASVLNIEVPTDHAITAHLYRSADKLGIPYILTGGNLATEAIMGKSWNEPTNDFKSIKSIHTRYGKIPLTGFPHLTLFDWVYLTFVKKIKFIPILNYCQYIKKDAKKLLMEKLEWKDYGEKHCESIYTRFFQGYYLPYKFNIDKRRGHLSTLICSGQIAREEALTQIAPDPYPNQEMLEQDKVYVLKKLGLTEDDFDKIMSQPGRSYKDFPNNEVWFKRFSLIVKYAKKKATYN